MRGGWSALLTILVTATAGHLVEPEAREELDNLKQRILKDLGMKRFPDMKSVNVSNSHMQRMMRKYYRSVRRNEQELLSYHPKGYEQTFLLFNPDWESMSSVQWARLKFPDSTIMDVTNAVHQWERDSSQHLMVSCEKPHCSEAKLELLVSNSRMKRSTGSCNRNECCKKSLKINFKEIGWDWVVQPPEFEAFYCKGRCRDVSHDFASTHALMQSILNFQGKNVSRPCCAPRRLRALDILHFNDKVPPELVVSRKKGMIVRECACL